MVYPVAILALLAVNIIPKAHRHQEFRANVHALAPGCGLCYWRTCRVSALRNTDVAVPLLVVRGRAGLFLFFYLCAVWLLCLNPLLAPWWMKKHLRLHLFSPCLSSPAAIPKRLDRSSGPRLARPADARERAITGAALAAIVLSFVFTYRGVSILPGNTKLGVGLEIADGMSVASSEH